MRVKILYNKKGDGVVYPHVDMISTGKTFLILTLRDKKDIELIRKNKIYDMTIYNREWEDEEE